MKEPSMKIILFEDNQSNNLRPIGLFHPLFELHTGAWTLNNLVKLLDIPVLTIIREHFLINESHNPNITTMAGESLLFLNASIEPDVRYKETILDLIQSGDPFITTSSNRVAAALVPPGKDLPETITSDTVSSVLLEMGLPLEHEIFKTIDWPHQVVDSHTRLFDTNLEHLISSGSYKETSPGVFLGENIELASSSVIDTSSGPVVIGDNVTILPYTYFAGPVYIGRDTRIIEHSSIKDHTSVGDVCKIGGEVETSTLEPYSNKQHHGFLGHSWVGRWVNLGAGTTTSDLKNTYGKIRVDYMGHRVDTGMQFLGSIIGDFVKTAINTTLFTGKIVGVCSMIYGTIATNVPSFSNYARSFGQVTEISIEQLITTQKRMYSRRGVEQNKYDIELMKRVFEMTKNERVMSDEQINF